MEMSERVVFFPLRRSLFIKYSFGDAGFNGRDIRRRRDGGICCRESAPSWAIKIIRKKTTQTIPILRYWFYGHDFTISSDAFQYSSIYSPGTSSALVFAHKTHAPFPSVFGREHRRSATSRKKILRKNVVS